MVALEIDGLPLAERLARIHAGVSALLTEHAPQEVAIERVFVNRNVDSALKLGQARGAAIAAALGGELPLAEYAPRAVELATVGTGAADKLQVAHMVRALLKPAGKLSADAADALRDRLAPCATPPTRGARRISGCPDDRFAQRSTRRQSAAAVAA
jgi:crossover junction endodeoxyribonuclease RuvC